MQTLFNELYGLVIYLVDTPFDTMDELMYWIGQVSDQLTYVYLSVLVAGMAAIGFFQDDRLFVAPVQWAFGIRALTYLLVVLLRSVDSFKSIVGRWM